MDRDRIRSIFNDALEERTDERRAFVEVACDQDPSLLREVRSLLEAHDRVKSFLDESPVPWAGPKMFAEALEVQEVSAVGERIGSYRVDKLLARGGMGSVYLCSRDDGAFRKQVAIKLLRFGADSESVARRFGRERQILAELDHSLIARLLDAGTTDTGIPYLIMEYVDGVRIDQYCDDHNLGLSDRVKLMSAVCSAVSFAHDHGVIHRDIKPSNILVTDDGQPKLLDFGIAKLVHRDPSQALTMTDMRPMTLKYASPEQVRGEDAGVASDEYSLAVLAYELFSGHLPYHLDNASPYEVLQAICEQEAVPLSESTTAVGPGELDAILGKALQKTPADRYHSVQDLQNDLDRYLNGLPTSVGIKRPFLSQWPSVRRAGWIAASIVMAIAVITGVVFVERDRPAATADAISQNSIGTEGTIPSDPDAAAHYLRAKNLWNRRTIKELEEAVGEFSAAIEKQPNFAPSYSGLANCYILLSVFGSADPEDAFDRARRAAERGIELAPDRADVHLSMAMIRWLRDWQWDAAESEFVRARELDPNYPLAPHWHGLFLAEMGRFDEAESEEKAALKIEPLSPATMADLARVYFYARRYKDAADEYRLVRYENPNFHGANGEMFEFYEAVGDRTEWLRTMGSWSDLPPEFRKQFRAGGMAAVHRWQVQTQNMPYSLFTAAIPRLSESEKDMAFASLDRAYNERRHWLVQIKVSPRFDALRSDPRFNEMLRKMNLL